MRVKDHLLSLEAVLMRAEGASFGAIAKALNARGM
jgi:hypothetical protein